MTSTKNLIAKLDHMKLGDLQAMFAEVTGEVTRSPNKVFLIRRIVEARQSSSAEPEASDTDPLVVANCEAQASTAGAETADYDETEAPAAEEENTEQPEASPTSEKLCKLDVAALKARYLEVVGRPTGSDSKAYLVWKIREAQKGRVPVGPRKSAHREGVTFKVLPLRMESDLVDKLDEAWRRQGLRSRMDLFRRSLQAFLAGAGEADVAAMLVTANA